ncbi:MAG: LysM peptidoglycan-binding domain-containing protein [Alistipes sp.]|nr:LysM peptidoglycan-binding domain-containing protein [Alistipes sp.]
MKRNRVNLFTVLAVAAMTLTACGTSTPKVVDHDDDKTFDGPEIVEAYETPDGNAAEADHIVISKASLTLRLYDKGGRLIASFPVGAGRSYGNKRGTDDYDDAFRSPEGELKVGLIQTAAHWRDGELGPWFIHLDVPNINTIGICGTKSPEVVGLRATTGNFVMRNDDLDSLRNMIYPNMPVTVIPAEGDLRADGKLTEQTETEATAQTADKSTPAEQSKSESKGENKSTPNSTTKSVESGTTDANGDVWHTIAKGEYLSNIAKKYNTTLKRLKELNPGIDVDRIREGQRIKVYSAADATTTTEPTPTKSESTTANAGEVWHTVVEGDLGSKIAKKYNTTLKRLKELNPNKDLDRIYPGQKLRVK